MIDRFQSRIKKPLIGKKSTAKSSVKKYAVNLIDEKVYFTNQFNEYEKLGDFPDWYRQVIEQCFHSIFY